MKRPLPLTSPLRSSSICTILLSRNIFGAVAALTLAASSSFAQSSQTTMNLVSSDGIGVSIGTIALSDSDAGLVLTTELFGLTPGEHGIHIHENPSCEAAKKDGVLSPAEGAGPHFDPAQSGVHLGPEGAGHAGDLPKLIVDAQGKAKQKLIARKLKMRDIQNRSIIIHAAGDNYADAPKPLGGGGARIACGIIR